MKIKKFSNINESMILSSKDDLIDLFQEISDDFGGHITSWTYIHPSGKDMMDIAPKEQILLGGYAEDSEYYEVVYQITIQCGPVGRHEINKHPITQIIDLLKLKENLFKKILIGSICYENAKNNGNNYIDAYIYTGISIDKKKMDDYKSLCRYMERKCISYDLDINYLIFRLNHKDSFWTNTLLPEYKTNKTLQKFTPEKGDQNIIKFIYKNND